MIIRSQNKKGIVNLENIVEIAAHDKKVVFNSAYSSVGLLGIYSTEEKAIEVLDMIQNAYTAGNEWLNTAGKVFQMPQDSEV